jgi:hypothetical protein
MDRNKVFIIGGDRSEPDPELISNKIAKALAEAKVDGEIVTDVYYQPSLSSVGADGFIVFCVPSLDCNPQTFHHAVIRGLEAAYPQLSKDQRFSIVILKQTMYER